MLCNGMVSIRNISLKKFGMKTISLKTAVAIAGDWHGGQWSALYSFASSAVIRNDNINIYLSEIEYNISSISIKKTEIQHLEKLKRFFIIKSRQAISQNNIKKLKTMQ